MTALLLCLSLGQLAEPIRVTQVEEFYEQRKAAGLAPRRPYLAFGDEMKVGHAGEISYANIKGESLPVYSVKILQILGPRKMLATFTRYEEKATGVIGKTVIWEPVRVGDTTVMVDGASTEGQADGKAIGIPGTWYVSGTESYQSTEGIATVFVIKPIRIPAPPEPIPVVETPKVAKESTGESEPKAKQPQRPSRKPIIREWTDSSGDYKVKAELRGVIGDYIRLKLADGRTIEIRLERLSRRDREFIEKLKGE